MSDKFVWHWQAAVLIRFKTTLNRTTITAVILNKVGITQNGLQLKLSGRKMFTKNHFDPCFATCN